MFENTSLGVLVFYVISFCVIIFILGYGFIGDSIKARRMEDPKNWPESMRPTVNNPDREEDNG